MSSNSAAPASSSFSNPKNELASKKKKPDDCTLDQIPEDALVNILLFLDFHTAAQYCAQQKSRKSNSKDKKVEEDDCDSGTISGGMQHVWREMYQRHRFSFEDLAPLLNETQQLKEANFLSACKKRRRLMENLLASSPAVCKKPFSPSPLSFGIPSTAFSFVPVAPFDDVDTAWDEEDPPPVDFDCDSFALTSTAVSSELLFLCPFLGTLSIYDSVKDNALPNDQEFFLKEVMAQIRNQQYPREIPEAGRENQDRRYPAEVPESSNENQSTGAPGPWVFVNASGSDDSSALRMVEQELSQQNHSIVRLKSRPGKEASLSKKQQRTGPRQYLLTSQDFFDISPSDYFPQHAPHHDEGELEIEVSYVGIDAKPVWRRRLGTAGEAHNYENEWILAGSMVAVGRNLSNDPDEGANSRHCIEVMAWFKNKTLDAVETQDSVVQRYGDRHVCRFAWSFMSLDLCASTKRVYASFSPGDGPVTTQDLARPLAARQQPDIADNPGDDAADEDNDNLLAQSTVVVYPMVPYLTDDESGQAETKPSPLRYFPDPEFLIHCKERVSAFALGSRGDELFVGTAKRKIELWNMPAPPSAGIGFPTDSSPSVPRRVQTIDVVKEVKTTFMVSRDQDTANAVVHPSPIESIHMPRHLPAATCGFVTLQHSVDAGSTLLLWKRESKRTDATCHNARAKRDAGAESRERWYALQSMIKLPLTAKRMPQIHYDGRRLIVFGQDHLGFIILVYHVLNSLEDIALFQKQQQQQPNNPRDAGCSGDQNASATPTSGSPTRAEEGFAREMSGGVYNLGTDGPACVRFANRIRHAALGGFEYYDSIHMTCNERYIVINTKSGDDLLTSGSGGSDLSCPYTDGLLVIDLDEHVS